MPDTLPKFGRDCKCSFRDLGPTKNLIFQKWGPPPHRHEAKIEENRRFFHEILNLKPRSGRISANQELKNFLEVFRNMPDTLPKFGRDCKCSFRDLGPTKKFNFPKMGSAAPPTRGKNRGKSSIFQKKIEFEAS